MLKYESVAIGFIKIYAVECDYKSIKMDMWNGKYWLFNCSNCEN